MNALKRSPAAPWIVLGVFALALRVGTVFLLWSPGGAVWTYEHGEIAENLLAGRGFSVTFLGSDGPTSQQAPLYPVLLAGAYGLFGTASPAAILAVQLLQCVAGTLVAIAVVWLGRSILPDRPTVGWIAGYGAAVYPAHVYMVTHIQVAVWAALLLTLLMAVVLDRRRSGRRLAPVLAGLIAGLLLLVEPIMALAAPIVAVMFWMRSQGGCQLRDGNQYSISGSSEVARGTAGQASSGTPAVVFWRGWRRLAPAVTFLVVTLAVVSPWLVRNALVHGEFVFVKSTFGYAFWQGNNPVSWGTDKIPKSSADTLRNQHDGSPVRVDRAMWEARHETIYIDDLLLKPGGYREFAGLSEPQRARMLGRRAVQFIRDNPARYVRLCVQRLRYFLLFDETNPKAAHPVYRLATVLWLFSAAVGFVLLRRRWRELWPTAAVFVAIAVFHSLTIMSARFRIPVEPLTFVWAAAAVHGAWLAFGQPLLRHDRNLPETWQTGNTRRAA